MDPRVKEEKIEKSPMMIRIERLEPGAVVQTLDGQTGTFVSRNWDGKPENLETPWVKLSFKAHPHQQAVLRDFDPNDLKVSRAPIEEQLAASAADKRPDHTVRSSPERTRGPSLSSR